MGVHVFCDDTIRKLTKERDRRKRTAFAYAWLKQGLADMEATIEENDRLRAERIHLRGALELKEENIRAIVDYTGIGRGDAEGALIAMRAKAGL